MRFGRQCVEFDFKISCHGSMQSEKECVIDHIRSNTYHFVVKNNRENQSGRYRDNWYQIKKKINGIKTHSPPVRHAGRAK